MSEAAGTAPKPEEESVALAAGQGRITRVFRHRNYRMFFIAQFVSLLGTWMQWVAQGWLVYELTHSPFILGLTGFLGQIPVLFGSPFGGALADRLDKRMVLQGTQISSFVIAAVLAGLTLGGIVETWHIIVLAFLLGVVNAIDIPTRHSFTIEMVGREDLRPAIALNAIVFNAARVVGPSVAGILVATVGEGICFTINALSYFAPIAAFAAMRLERQPPRKHAPALQAIREGWDYVGGHVRIRTALLLLAACSIFGAGYMTLLPVFARDILHHGSDGMGYLMSCVGLGALFGAYAMTRIADNRLATAPAIAAMAFGIALVLFANSQIFALSLALLVPTSFSLMLQSAATNNLVQHLSDEHMRGRVMSFFAMAFMGLMPVGSLILGTLADWFGAPLAVTLGGLACIACALFAYQGGHLTRK